MTRRLLRSSTGANGTNGGGGGGAANAPKPVHLTLAKGPNLVRQLRSGHPWIYADALAAPLPGAPPPGALALVKTPDGDIVAKGWYDRGSRIAFRAVAVRDRRLDDALVEARLGAALALRRRLFGGGGGGGGSGARPAAAAAAAAAAATTGFRLVNGEGDLLPGLVIDVYGSSSGSSGGSSSSGSGSSTAVLKLDGPGAEGFYDAGGVASWLAEEAGVACVYWKFRSGGGGKKKASSQVSNGGGRGSSRRGGGGGAAAKGGSRGAGGGSSTHDDDDDDGDGDWGDAASSSSSSGTTEQQQQQRGRTLVGAAPAAPVEFLENGLRFQADVVLGQKTGFFLDQRDSRHWLRSSGVVAAAGSGGGGGGARVLNLFSYTGGFSVAAGAAGAAHVTSVDAAAAAVAAAGANWLLNGLPPARHEGVAADAFAFLEAACAARERFDVVVVDPPSFAPNKASVPAALSSYERLYSLAARVTAPGGTLCLSSCSSHVNHAAFDAVCEAALSRARRCGRVLAVIGQPADHPWPLACPELRYLKFTALALD